MFVREISRSRSLKRCGSDLSVRNKGKYGLFSHAPLRYKQSAMQNIKFNPHTPEKLLQFLQESDILTV